jgi:hypothetical protein
MGTIIKQEKTNITTSDGLRLIRRVTTVEMPNGKFRYPVDYYESTSGVTKVSKQELESLRIPTYKQMI